LLESLHDSQDGQNPENLSELSNLSSLWCTVFLAPYRAARMKGEPRVSSRRYSRGDIRKRDYGILQHRIKYRLHGKELQ